MLFFTENTPPIPEMENIILDILTEVEPALMANLNLAYQEYMSGDLSRGAYECVRARYALVISLMQDPSTRTKTTLRELAFATLDLKAAIADNLVPDVPADLMLRWWEAFRNAGFVDAHPFFDVPWSPIIEQNNHDNAMIHYGAREDRTELDSMNN